MNTSDELLRAALRRSRRVIAGQRELVPLLEPILPIDEDSIEQILLAERIASVALLKRYEQLQDLVGRIGRLVITWEGGDTEGLTRRDLANWLERFGAVSDADDYVAASALRNRLVHDYPLEEDEQVRRVNACWAGFPQLIGMIDGLHRHMARRGFDFDGD